MGALLYTAAMSCFAAYWRQAALGMGGRPGSLEVQRAYFASQLGKYIPGKAWVILIRCALLDNQTTTTPVIIASTFYETLAMMAAGSVLALVALLAVGNARPAMLALAAGLTAGLLLAVLPPVFGRLTTWTARSFQKAGSVSIATITYATWFQAFRYCIPGWMAVGIESIGQLRVVWAFRCLVSRGLSAGLWQRRFGHCGWVCSVDCSGGPRRQRVGHDADLGTKHWDQQRSAPCNSGPDHARIGRAVCRGLPLSARKTKESKMISIVIPVLNEELNLAPLASGN